MSVRVRILAKSHTHKAHVRVRLEFWKKHTCVRCACGRKSSVRMCVRARQKIVATHRLKITIIKTTLSKLDGKLRWKIMWNIFNNSKKSSNSDLLMKKGTPEVWNQFVCCVSCKGIKRHPLRTELFLVMKENVWKPDIVIFQTPLKPPWDPRSVYFTQGT